MKITDVRALTLSCPLSKKLGGAFRNQRGSWRREMLLIRVETDDGLVGWGESFALPSVGSVIVSKVLRPLVIGKDPLDHEALWESMYFGLGYGGVKGVMVEALSGVDIALWDIRGKQQSRSVSELLAAAIGTSTIRARVDCYAAGLFYEPLVDLLDEARGYVEKGFRAIKMKVGLGLDEDLARVAAVRKAIGDDTTLRVDANCGYDVSDAQSLEQRMRAFNVDWLEEPVIVEDLHGYRMLKENSEIRIAGGEGEYTRWGFRELLSVVDVAQPDVIRCGGLTEMVRILQMAAQRKVPIAPHQWAGAVCQAATLHISAVAPTFETFEYDGTPNALRESLTREPFDCRDGTVAVPKSPGLGIELDDDALARYLVAVS